MNKIEQIAEELATTCTVVLDWNDLNLIEQKYWLRAARSFIEGHIKELKLILGDGEHSDEIPERINDRIKYYQDILSQKG